MVTSVPNQFINSTINMVIIINRSSTDTTLSIPKRCKACKLDRKNRIKLNKKLFKHITSKSLRWKCKMKYPIKKVRMVYVTPSTNFKLNILLKCLLNRCLCWAILRLLKLVNPKSRKILRSNEKLKITKYSPKLIFPTCPWTLGSTIIVQNGLIKRFKTKRIARSNMNFFFCTKGR